MTTTTQDTAGTRRSTVPAALAAIASAAVAGVLACLVIATVATRASVSDYFPPMMPGSYASLTVVAVAVGAIGWAVVRSRAADARRLLTRMVPAVLVLSIAPDILLGTTQFLAHTSWAGVAALVVMHVAVAAVAVASYAYFLPVRPGER